MCSVTEGWVNAELTNLTWIIIAVDEIPHIALVNEMFRERRMREVDARIKHRNDDRLVVVDAFSFCSGCRKSFVQPNSIWKPLLTKSFVAAAYRPRTPDGPRASLRPRQTGLFDLRQLAIDF